MIIVSLAPLGCDNLHFRTMRLPFPPLISYKYIISKIFNFFKYSQKESNPHHRGRNPVFYPLNYESIVLGTGIAPVSGESYSPILSIRLTEFSTKVRIRTLTNGFGDRYATVTPPMRILFLYISYLLLFSYHYESNLY